MATSGESSLTETDVSISANQKNSKHILTNEGNGNETTPHTQMLELKSLASGD